MSDERYEIDTGDELDDEDEIVELIEIDDEYGPIYWYKKEVTDTLWWKRIPSFGQHIFSFDKKKEYNLFRDYPHELTAEEIEIFDKENPHWAKFFSYRKKAT